MAESEYERGVIAGGIESRLAGHDKHFAKINGSLDEVAKQLNALALGVQRLADQAVSRDATVITTAAALKDAEEVRRNSSTQRWEPKARTIAVLTVVLAVVAIVVTLVVTRTGG